MSLYLVDWDTTSRSERIDVVDPTTGAVLASQTVSSFHGGEYVSFTITGHVEFVFTTLAGYNAVLSGLFIDAATETLEATYAYDAMGRRIEESYTGGTTNDLYYSPDWNVIEARQGGTASSDVHYQYVWDASGNLVLRDTVSSGSIVSGDRIYTQWDANGDITAITNSSGMVEERYEYSPYGVVTVLTASGSPVTGNVSPYGWHYLFQGGQQDSGTGLYIFEHRDYNPGSGTWMQRDPMGLAAGDENLYRFTENDPVFSQDPSGYQRRIDIPAPSIDQDGKGSLTATPNAPSKDTGTVKSPPTSQYPSPNLTAPRQRLDPGTINDPVPKPSPKDPIETTWEDYKRYYSIGCKGKPDAAVVNAYIFELSTHLVDLQRRLWALEAKRIVLIKTLEKLDAINPPTVESIKEAGKIEAEIIDNNLDFKNKRDSFMSIYNYLKRQKKCPKLDVI